MSGNTAAATLPIIVWAGMNSYTIDLAALSTAPDGGLEPLKVPEAWTAGNKRHLRFDPHEFGQARTFHIDDIKLTAKPVAGSSFTISFWERRRWRCGNRFAVLRHRHQSSQRTRR